MFEGSRKEKTTRAIFTVILISFAVALVYMLRSFIDAFLGSIILYVLFRPLMRNLCEKRKWRRGWASAFIMLLSFVIVMVPVFSISYLLVSRLTLFFSDTSIVMQMLNDVDKKIFSYTGVEVLTSENIQALQTNAAGYITDILGQSLSMLADVAIMYFVLFYLLAGYGKWGSMIKDVLPLEDEKIHEFTAELKSMTFSNALGAPVLALIQGMFAYVGYLIFGVQEPLFWGLMTGCFSFIPVIGSTMIWLPASIVQLSSGFIWQGVGLLLYGALVISVVDNVFRFVFQKKFANVHPLVTVLGVIAGIPLFGFPGIIFGPLLISYFLLLLKMYQHDYSKSNTLS